MIFVTHQLHCCIQLQQQWDCITFQEEGMKSRESEEMVYLNTGEQRAGDCTIKEKGKNPD